MVRDAVKPVLVFLGLLVCTGIAAAVLLQVPFTTVDRGMDSGVRQRKRVVIETQKEWDTLWRAHKKGSAEKARVPIDFKHEMAVAAFLGEKKTGGYDVEITKVEEDAQKRRVTIFFRETRPPRGAAGSEALTQPYHIVKLKKTTFKVVFSAER